MIKSAYRLAAAIALVCVTCVALIIAGNSSQLSRVRREGGLVCNDAIWDFGRIGAWNASHTSNRLTHDFTLVNESTESITIDEVRSSCGCMAAEGFDRELAPGGSTRISAEVSLMPESGPFQKSFVVFARTSVPIRLPLDVIGDVEGISFASTPARLNFGTMKVDEVKHRELRLIDVQRFVATDFTIRASSPALHCIFATGDSTRPGERAISVSLDAKSATPGRFFETITISSKRRRQADLQVPVVALIALEERQSQSPKTE